MRANFPPQKGVSLSRLSPLHFVPVKIGPAGVKTPRNWATCLPVESIELLPTAFLLLQMCRGKVRIVLTLAPHILVAQARLFSPNGQTRRRRPSSDSPQKRGEDRRESRVRPRTDPQEKQFSAGGGEIVDDLELGFLWPEELPQCQNASNKFEFATTADPLAAAAAGLSQALRGMEEEQQCQEEAEAKRGRLEHNH